MAAMTEAGTERQDVRPANGRRRLIDLGLLYASKSGAIVTGLLILPLFNRMLGPELFGLVALIFSLQAFLVILDFGMSTMVGRDLAAANLTASQRYGIWRAAELAISFLYLVLAPAALVISWHSDSSLSSGAALACVVLFWSLTLQNIGQSALLARHHFTEAALIQVFGVLSRHGLTAFALAWITPTLTCFVLTQAAAAALQMLVTRWRCNLALRPPIYQREIGFLSRRAVELLRVGRPLMLFGLAGAAVMQLDKVIVSGLISSRELAPYFLAASFCLTPLSVLAAPVAQFFQPRLIHAVSAGSPDAMHRILKQFNRCIVACALLPTAVIWLLREPLIGLWLHHATNAERVTHYSAVLLPGIAIGALGYVPYIILLSRQDYSFQARLSLILTTVTLSAVVVAALQGSVLAVCVVYTLYHSASTIGSWWRCIHLDSTGQGVAATAARQAALTTLMLMGSTGFLAALAAELGYFR